MRQPRILLADDHALVLNGVRTLLEPYCDVVGTASDGKALLDAALEVEPEMVVLDVSMPRLNGFEAARRIKEALPSTQLIFLSMHSNPLYLKKALEAGADGYVLKTGVAEELLDAIRAVSDGGSYVSPGFPPETSDRHWSHKTIREREDLTARQAEILQLIAEGRLSKEIAHSLGISLKTVEFHRTRLMARLGARSAAELVRLAVEGGLIPSSTPPESEPTP